MRTLLMAVTTVAALAAAAPPADATLERAKALFKPLSTQADSKDNPVTPEKVTLGRQLFFEKRLSKNHDVACNSCHVLSKYGVDNEPTSPGHKKQRGDRNSPSVYNAGVHFVQFWDGRAKDLEEQAKGPVLNPVEMAMPDAATVETVLASIPGYEPLFKAAFPGQARPITYDNAARAIGAFERTLMTPSRFDRYLGGDAAALTESEKQGLATFLNAGCATCHLGEGVGGAMYQKLGLVKPVAGLKDEGRSKISKNEAEKFFFKVPSLRNVEKTGPYLHDGSKSSLEDTVVFMGEYQLGKQLKQDEVEAITTFLKALTGALPKAEHIAEPKPLAAGKNTPKPDPK
ncbi:MAG: c-type cytochrome [Archangium sp.]|nr:c-type cytochrome [Archangium sp.]